MDLAWFLCRSLLSLTKRLPRPMRARHKRFQVLQCWSRMKGTVKTCPRNPVPSSRQGIILIARNRTEIQFHRPNPNRAVVRFIPGECQLAGRLFRHDDRNSQTVANREVHSAAAGTEEPVE